MKTWAKVTIGIGTALAVVGGGVGLGLYLKGKDKNPNNGSGNGDDNNNDGNGASKGDNNEPQKTESVIGKTAYSDTGVNLRMSAKVDDGWHDNKLKEMATGDLGVVVSVTKGETDGLNWYYIKLNEPIWDYLPYPTHENYAYVRGVDEKGNQIVKFK